MLVFMELLERHPDLAVRWDEELILRPGLKGLLGPWFLDRRKMWSACELQGLYLELKHGKYWNQTRYEFRLQFVFVEERPVTLYSVKIPQSHPSHSPSSDRFVTHWEKEYLPMAKEKARHSFDKELSREWLFVDEDFRVLGDTPNTSTTINK